MIPEGWVQSTLEEHIDIKHGFAFKSEFFANEGEYILMTPGHFYEAGGFRDQRGNTKYYIGEIPKGYILEKDDVVLAMTEQAVGLLGSAAYVPESNKYLHNQRLGLLKVKDSQKACIDFLYLIYNSPSIRKQIAEQGSGTKVKHTSPDKLKGIVTLIPPLPEQKKIAQILSTWDKAITTTEQLLANSQQQKKALMQQLLTGKKRLKGFSGTWQTAKLGRLTEKVGSGITPTGGSNVYASSGIPFIRSQNVLWGKLDFSDVAYINDSQHKKMSSSSVLPNDVLLNITGASIGRCCTVPEKLKTSNVNQHVCIIRPKKNLNSDYLKSFLLSHYGQKQIEQFQAGGNRQGLNFEQIKSFKIHIPEFEEQKAIVAVLSAADREIEILQQKLGGLKQEKKALMQQLLTGKRRVQV